MYISGSTNRFTLFDKLPIAVFEQILDYLDDEDIIKMGDVEEGSVSIYMF